MTRADVAFQCMGTDMRLVVDGAAAAEAVADAEAWLRLADANLWTNQLSLTDVGLNWHLTKYLKVYLDWQHADFGSPVQFAPGRRQSTSDMFLLRAQLFF